MVGVAVAVGVGVGVGSGRGRGRGRGRGHQVSRIEDPRRVEGSHQFAYDVDASTQLRRKTGRLRAAHPMVVGNGSPRLGRRAERGFPGTVVGLDARIVPSCARGGTSSRGPGERKIDAAAVRISMTQVRHHEDVLAERAPYPVVEALEIRPARCDLHRVDEGPVGEDGSLAVADGVPVLEPPTGRPFTVPPGRVRGALEQAAGLSEPLGARFFRSFEDGDEHRATERPGSRARVEQLVEKVRTSQHASEHGSTSTGCVLLSFSLSPATPLGDQRIEGVVETRHGWPQARLEEGAHRLPAGPCRREGPRAERPCRRQRVQPQDSARDDRQRSLAAHNQGNEVRARRTPLRVHDVAGPRDAFERRRHVLDLAVRPRALPRAPRRDPPAHGAA